MEYLGRVTYPANKGEIVARVKNAPKEGSKVFDDNRSIVGKVSDIFGPVENPYVMIRLNRNSKDPHLLKDKSIFVEGGSFHGEDL